MARCLMVLGIHRSGTSATAGALHALGVPMGRVLIPATEANAKGHFEDAEFTALNEQALGSWHAPVPRLKPLRAQYEKHLRIRAAEADVFGLKDPRLALVTEYLWDWMQQLVEIDDVRAIVVRRPFLQTVSSLRKRDGWSRDRAIQIQSIYQYKLVETVERLGELGVPCYSLEFSELIDDPRQIVGQIAQFAFDGRSDAPGDERLREAAAFIDPDLRNHTEQTAA